VVDNKWALSNTCLLKWIVSYCYDTFIMMQTCNVFLEYEVNANGYTFVDIRTKREYDLTMSF